MKRTVKTNLIFFLGVIFSTMIITGCSENNEDPIPDPNKEMPDPEGTVLISITNNAFQGISISDAGNFYGTNWTFAGMGAMHGLGNIVTIPQNEYVAEYSVREGYGYVGQRLSRSSNTCSSEYIRFWVEYYYDTGAEIRYQYPFAGLNKDIPVVSDVLTLESKSNATDSIQFKEMIAYSASINQSGGWLQILGNTSKSFQIGVTSANTDFAEREAAITIRSGTQEKIITIKQKGRPTFSGGSGVQNDPYIITTAEQLASIDQYGYFKLGKDIDLTTYLKNSELGWEPIEFSSSFDGNGHSISGLWINRPSMEYVGLFGRLIGNNSSVSNLHVLIASKGITGGRYTGGITGYLDGSISKCSVEGNIITGGECTGGIVGWVGIGSSIGSIADSYSTSNIVVNASSGYACGIAYAGYYASQMIRCYYAGNITVGGSVLKYGISNGGVGSSYYDSSIAGSNMQDSYWARITADMKQKATYSGWDFTTVWNISEGVSYPTLR